MWNKKELSQLDCMLTRGPLTLTLTLTFDLEFSKSNCILGMGGPIVIKLKRRESIGCPDVKHKGNESTGFQANWVTFDLDIWPWIFKVKLYPGNGRPFCHGSPFVMESIGCPDVKHNHYVTEAEDTVRDQGDLRCWHYIAHLVFLAPAENLLWLIHVWET